VGLEMRGLVPCAPVSALLLQSTRALPFWDPGLSREVKAIRANGCYVL